MFLGIFGEAELILGISGAKAKYFQGAEDFLRDLGRLMHCFREHRPIWASVMTLLKTLRNAHLMRVY